jgi:hypothetical protein
MESVAWSAQRIPTAVFSASYTGATILSTKKFLNSTHETVRTPFQNHYFSENLVEPGI